MEVTVSSYGGIISSINVPDRDGAVADVTLGCGSLEDYKKHSPYFGAIIGRFGNRIGGSKFSIDGNEYNFVANNDVNHLHGGSVGFDKVVWDSAEFSEEGAQCLKLKYTSLDGEEGYPGKLNVEVLYKVTEDGELIIEYTAKTDKPTHVNLTNHAYFNLAGHDSGNVLEHELLINSDLYTPTDSGNIPTGEIRSVENSPFDFRVAKAIGQDIRAEDDQIKYGGGYDHNYVVNKLPEEIAHAATAKDLQSGRIMEVYTTEPGIQFYTGNFMDNIPGKGGVVYNGNDGFCLETQHFPDSPNKSMFPSTRLDPGQVYHSVTIYKFGVE